MSTDELIVMIGDKKKRKRLENIAPDMTEDQKVIDAYGKLVIASVRSHLKLESIPSLAHISSTDIYPFGYSCR